MSELLIYETGDGANGVTVRMDGELMGDAVSANFALTASDGKTYQTRFFNLDTIISVGYRVNSKRGVRFRQWARGYCGSNWCRATASMPPVWLSAASPRPNSGRTPGPPVARTLSKRAKGPSAS